MTADVFKSEQNKCTYAVDTRHFPVDPDHECGVTLLAKQIIPQEDELPVIHGVPKDGVEDIRGRNLQCIQEVGGITPELEPFTKTRDLRKLVGILTPLDNAPKKKELDQWMKESPLVSIIQTGDHYCQTSMYLVIRKFQKSLSVVPLVVTSQLMGGCQTVVIRVPGCRFSGKAAKHFHSAYFIIGPALKEDPLLIVKYYSFHKAYSTLDLKVSFSNLLKGSHPLISENLQLLCTYAFFRFCYMFTSVHH